MTPQDFLDSVVIPNVAEVSSNRGSKRLAVNALLSLDAFVGILFAHLDDAGRRPVKDDIAFRDQLALENEDYRLVRDAAFALKHGELKNPKPRLVRKADELTSVSGAFDAAIWDKSAFDTEDAIWIEPVDDPDRSQAVDALCQRTHEFLETVLARTGCGGASPRN